MTIINYSDLITKELVQSLCNPLYINGTEIMDEIVPHLLKIFSFRCENIVLEMDNITNQNLTSIGQAILDDSLSFVLFITDSANPDSFGFFYTQSKNAIFPQEINFLDKLSINTATEKELAILPMIGNKISENIIKNRINNGFFDSINELTNRIDGLGVAAVEELSSCFHFHKPNFLLKPKININSKFEEKINFFYSNIESKIDKKFTIIETLKLIASVLANNRTDKNKEFKFDTHTYHDNEFKFSEVSFIGNLINEQYYYQLQTIIGEAKKSIDICMFHISFADKKHPTVKLLEALLEAKERGVKIRVLVDKDRETDPYGSVIINSNAIKYFIENGIECREDNSDVLLHSKFLIFDKKTIVIGSHNWSAGSYFQYEDISLFIESKQLAAQLNKRFTEIWNNSK